MIWIVFETQTQKGGKVHLIPIPVCNEWTANVALISVAVWSCACLLDVFVRMHRRFAASHRLEPSSMGVQFLIFAFTDWSVKLKMSWFNSLHKFWLNSAAF